MTTVRPESGELFTVREAAKRLRVSEKTVRRMLQSGTLAHRRVGNQVRIAARDLEIGDLGFGVQERGSRLAHEEIGRVPVPAWAEPRVLSWRTALQRLIPSHHDVHVVVMDRRGAKTFRILGIPGFAWGTNLWHSNAIDAAPDAEVRRRFARSQVILFDEMVQHGRKLAALRARLERLHVAVQTICLVRRRSQMLTGRFQDAEITAIEDLDDDAFARTATLLSRLLARRAPPMDVDHPAVVGKVSRDPTNPETLAALSEFGEAELVWLADSSKGDAGDAITLDRPCFFDPSRLQLPDGITASWTGPAKIRGYYDRTSQQLVLIFVAFPDLEGSRSAWTKLIRSTKARFGGSTTDVDVPCTDDEIELAYADVCTDASLELLKQSVDAGLLMVLGMAEPRTLPLPILTSVFGGKRAKRVASGILNALRPMPGRTPFLPQCDRVPLRIDTARAASRHAKTNDARLAVLENVPHRAKPGDPLAKPATYADLMRSTRPIEELNISIALDYELDAGTVQPVNERSEEGDVIRVQRAYLRGEFDGDYLRTYEDESTRRARIVAINALDLWLQHSGRDSEDAVTIAALLSNLVHDWGGDLPAIDLAWRPFRSGAMPVVPPGRDALLPVLVQCGHLQAISHPDGTTRYVPNRGLPTRAWFSGPVCPGVVTARVRGLVRAYWAIESRFADRDVREGLALPSSPLVLLSSARNERIAYTSARFELVSWVRAVYETFLPALMDVASVPGSGGEQEALVRAAIAEIVASSRALRTKLDMYRAVPAMRRLLQSLFDGNALDSGDIILDSVDVAPRFIESFSDTDYPVALLDVAARIVSPFTELLQWILRTVGIEPLDAPSTAGSESAQAPEPNVSDLLNALLEHAPEVSASIGPTLSLAVDQARSTGTLDPIIVRRLRIACDEIVRVLKARIHDLQRDPLLDERRRKLETDFLRISRILADQYHAGFVAVGDFHNFVNYASHAAEMFNDDLQTIAEKIQQRMTDVATAACDAFPSCRVVGDFGDTIVMAGPSATDVLLATMELCKKLRIDNEKWDRDIAANAVDFMRFGIAKFDRTSSGPTAPPAASWTAYRLGAQRGMVRGKVCVTQFVYDELLDSVKPYLSDEPEATENNQGRVRSWRLDAELESRAAVS